MPLTESAIRSLPIDPDSNSRISTASNGRTFGIFSGETGAQAKLIAWCYNVQSYGASGSGVKTTGAIAASSVTLTVASTASFRAGHGIFIAGAGTAGGRFVSRIASIAGNVMNLENPAVTTVSGAVVQHDDTAAINAAIAECYYAGGGTVFAPNGHYRINGPFDGVTNSLITFPKREWSLSPVSIRIIGEATGQMNQNFSSALGLGTTLDCTDTVATAARYSFAAATRFPESGSSYDGFPGSWNALETTWDDMLILTAANPTIDGLNFYQSTRLTIGDRFALVSKSLGSGDSVFQPNFAEPTFNSGAGTVGIWQPGGGNNVILGVGSCAVLGFGVGIVVGEHAHFNRPAVIWCKVGYMLPANYHLITGSICFEGCIEGIKATGDTVVDLTVQFEAHPPGKWYSQLYTISDSSNHIRGDMRLAGHGSNNGNEGFVRNGGQNVTVRDLQTAPRLNIVTEPGPTVTLSNDNAGPQRVIRLTSSGNVSIVPSVDMAVGTVWNIEQAGTGVGTVGTNGGAVTRNGNKFSTAGQWSSMKVWVSSTNALSFSGGEAVEVIDYYSSVMAKNPLFYHRLASTSGTTDPDQKAGTDLNLSASGITKGVSGAVAGNNAMEFNGTSAYASKAVALSALTAFSLEFWLKDIGPDFQVLLETSENSNLHSGAFGVFIEDGILQVSVQRGLGDTPTGGNVRDLDEALDTSDWTHIVIAVDKSASVSNAVKIFVNGVAPASTLQFNSAPTTFYDGTLNVGSRNSTLGFMEGGIDEIALYPYALTVEQAAENYSLRDA